MAWFRRTGEEVAVGLPPELRQLLGELATQTAELLAGAAASPFPPAQAPPVPLDPALARLLPTAYDDEEAATEFRRLTESDLRAAKRTDADRLASTAQHDLVVVEDAECWVRAINDMRLVLGSRLGLVTDSDADRVLAGGGSQAQTAVVQIYKLLTVVQDDLIETLDALPT